MILSATTKNVIGNFILGIPIIGDIFYVLLAFITGLVTFSFVFFIIIFPLEYIAVQVFNRNFILTYFFDSTGTDNDIYAYLNNSYSINIWLCLLISFNSLAIRYNFQNNEDILYLCILWAIGLIPAFIAYNKGRNFYNWWMYGHLLFLVAVPHALSLKETEPFLIRRGVLKKCPYCAETVRKEASVCKHCGKTLV